MNLLALYRNQISVSTCRGKECVGCTIYADDVLLLSSSVVQLQRMLDLCEECGDKLNIIFNASISVLFKVGKVFREKLDNLYLGTPYGE